MLPHEVHRRLKERFGYGGNPLARRRLFDLVQRLCTVHEEPACRLVAELVVQAAEKRMPDLWFCFAVTRRLRESGMGAESPPVSMDNLITGAELERRQSVAAALPPAGQTPPRQGGSNGGSSARAEAAVKQRAAVTAANEPVRMFQPLI